MMLHAFSTLLAMCIGSSLLWTPGITFCYTCPLEIASVSINLASNAHTLHDSNLTSVLGGRFVGYLKQLLSLQDCLHGKCNHFWLVRSFR